jgi:ribosomal subunit interface protein
MQIPVTLSFKDFPVSDAVEADVMRHAQRLEHFYDRITRCDVTIAEHHKHHHKGRLYSVQIDLSLPHHELVINRDHADNHAHEDVYVAIRDAFDAARRQLEDCVRQMRRQVKTHPVAHAAIDKDMPHATKR